MSRNPVSNGCQGVNELGRGRPIPNVVAGVSRREKTAKVKGRRMMFVATVDTGLVQQLNPCWSVLFRSR